MKVEQYQLREHVSSVAIPLPGSVEFTPSARWPWLQRKLISILRRLGCREALYLKYNTEMERVTMDFDSLAAAVCQCREDLSRVYRREAKYLIIGRDRYDDLLHAKTAAGLYAVEWPVDHQAQVAIDGRRRPLIFQGLIVAFVPWIDGVFVLPDLGQEVVKPPARVLQGSPPWRLR
jgi:hypothetical protein